MIPLNPWEHQNAIKSLYSKCVEAVCDKHSLTRMELDILLFLANNPLFDTASDIVQIRCLSKSQVSAAVGLLEKRNFLKKSYAGNNRKTVHLEICQEAADAVQDGKAAQERFLQIIFKGIPEKEIEAMKRANVQMLNNIHEYLKEESK